MITALAALAQESRLKVFRLLTQAGTDGLSAGKISQLTNIPPSSLSFHLRELTTAGLVTSRQEGRYVYYNGDFAAMQKLVNYLMENCCASDVDSTMKIYHNPNCGTSRKTLALLRESGYEPQVIEYLKTPPTRDELKDMIAKSGLSVREALREKGTPYHELNLGNPELTDDQLLDAMMQHPILINRPFVVTDLGVRLCRPMELVHEILPVAR